MEEIKNCIYCQNQINNKEDKEGCHLDEKWWEHLKNIEFVVNVIEFIIMKLEHIQPNDRHI